MYSKVKSIAGLVLVIVITGFLILAVVSNNSTSSNALANQLANYKLQEIQAEQQIQLWQAKKTEATKGIIEMNGKISAEIKATSPEAIPFQ